RSGNGVLRTCVCPRSTVVSRSRSQAPYSRAKSVCKGAGISNHRQRGSRWEARAYLEKKPLQRTLRVIQIIPVYGLCPFETVALAVNMHVRLVANLRAVGIWVIRRIVQSVKPM